MLTGNEKIELIQGDGYRYEIRLTNEETLNFMIDFFENKKLDKPANA